MGSEVKMGVGTVNDFVWGGKVYLRKLIFAVLLLKEEVINDLETAEIKSSWVLSCGVPENACSLRVSKKPYRMFSEYFNKVAGQEVC